VAVEGLSARLYLDHCGIILSIPPPWITYGEFLRRLLAFLDRVTADDLVNRVRWLNPVE